MGVGDEVSKWIKLEFGLFGFVGMFFNLFIGFINFIFNIGIFGFMG